MKTCKDCSKEFPLEDFPLQKQSKDGHLHICFPCKRLRDKKYSQTYRERHPEERRRSARNYQRRNSIKYNERARLQKYGLDREAVEAMLEAQNGVCGLCERDFSQGETFVDHDHTCCPGRYTCGRCIRKILCRACNQGLGLLQDDPEFLRKAADYVEQHRNAR